VAVVDLGLRLTRQARPRRIDDQVVVVALEAGLLGLVVDEVLDVVELEPADIEPTPAWGGVDAGESRLVPRVAKSAGFVLGLLDAQALALPETDDRRLAAALAAHAAPVSAAAGDDSPVAEGVFAARARHLAQSADNDAEGLLPLAVIRLGGERFGVAVDVVRGFCKLGPVTPVPCCPPHIVGQTPLRGDVLTLVDIRGELHLPPAAPDATPEVMMVEAGGAMLGVLVDEVLDVAYVMPPATATGHTGQEARAACLAGRVPFADEVLTVIDVGVLLAQEALAVRDEV
jgi:purine-binding chemotaxis protein CheW